MHPLLKKLNLEEVNAGASTGSDQWIRDPAGKELISYNPADNQPIASVIQATSDGYEQVASAASDSFMTWQDMPAPKRGLIFRRRHQVLNSAHRNCTPLSQMRCFGLASDREIDRPRNDRTASEVGLSL